MLSEKFMKNSIILIFCCLIAAEASAKDPKAPLHKPKAKVWKMKRGWFSWNRETEVYLETRIRTGYYNGDFQRRVVLAYKPCESGPKKHIDLQGTTTWLHKDPENRLKIEFSNKNRVTKGEAVFKGITKSRCGVTIYTNKKYERDFDRIETLCFEFSNAQEAKLFENKI